MAEYEHVASIKATEVATEALQTSTGADDATKVTDPDAASATVVSLLRGILEKLGEIEVNTTPA